MKKMMMLKLIRRARQAIRSPCLGVADRRFHCGELCGQGILLNVQILLHGGYLVVETCNVVVQPLNGCGDYPVLRTIRAVGIDQGTYLLVELLGDAVLVKG
jgi:hypothetical protein